jgi:hypothetical protein
VTATSHSVSEVVEPRRNLPYLSRVSAQRKAELFCLRLAPAITGGAIAYSHLHSEWQGLLVFACMFLAVTALRRPRYPLHLIPLASATLYLLAPPLGAAGAVLISVSDGSARWSRRCSGLGSLRPSAPGYCTASARTERCASR